MARLMKITYKFDDCDYRRVTHLLSHRYTIDIHGRLIRKTTHRTMASEVFRLGPKCRRKLKCMSDDVHDYRKCNWLICYRLELSLIHAAFAFALSSAKACLQSNCPQHDLSLPFRVHG
jgi:hypothetical protein